MSVSFAQAAEEFRVGVYAANSKGPRYAKPEGYFRGPWKRGDHSIVTLRLDGLKGGRYVVEVEPCRANKRCGVEPATKFPLDVPYK